MDASPDTLIGSTIYKTITEYNNYTGTWVVQRTYFVRSDPDGKGYVFLPDSMAEFLTGDISAQVGDTVADVLFAISGPNYVSYFLRDLAVDSIVVLTNAGVTVTRHYLDPLIFNPVGSYGVFWQAGSGTSFGPVLEGSGLFELCGVGGTIQYDLGNSGLPGPAGVKQICWPLHTGIVRSTSLSKIFAIPNPSTGQFTFTAQLPILISVYDAFGRLVLQTFGKSVDLSSEPEGIYVAKVSSNATGNRDQVVRLVVAR